MYLAFILAVDFLGYHCCVLSAVLFIFPAPEPLLHSLPMQTGPLLYHLQKFCQYLFLALSVFIIFTPVVAYADGQFLAGQGNEAAPGIAVVA